MAKADRNETNIEMVNPGFLKNYVEEDHSLDALKQHVVVPRLKLVQATSDSALRKQFVDGSVILNPSNVLIAGPDESFQLVPVFFFTEYCKWNPPGENPAVLETSFDPRSDIAKRSMDAKRRFEVFPGDEAKDERDQRQVRYVTHLRFIAIVYGNHEMVGTPVTLSFERGEFMQGKGFISAVSMRRQIIEGSPYPVPLWAQVWELTPGFREPEQNRKWWGFDYVAPDPALIKEGEVETMQLHHKEFSEAHEEQRLIVQDDDSGNVSDEATATDEM